MQEHDQGEPVTGMDSRQSSGDKAYLAVMAIAAIIIAIAVFFGFGCASTGGNGGESALSAASTAQSAQESPANYGTSPAEIARGGHTAHANGKTYSVQSGGTAIEFCEDGSNSTQVLYRNDDAGLEDAWGNVSHSGFPISCLHVTDDSLVFIEWQSDGSGESYYNIVRTNLDGTGREEVLRKLSPSGYGTPHWASRSFMWLDQGRIYYRTDCLRSQSLDGSDDKRVADVGKDAACSVADGVVYSSSDGGRSVTAYDTSSGESKTVFDSDWTEGPLVVRTIVPAGDRIYYGVAAESTRVPNKIEGYVSVDLNGSDLRDESGLPS